MNVYCITTAAAAESGCVHAGLFLLEAAVDYQNETFMFLERHSSTAPMRCDREFRCIVSEQRK
jgi:hypothetical protein